MTRGDIADFLGLTTETVSRVFTRLRQKGLITYDAAKHVVLRDRPALAALAEGS
jgi:CRP/FNR family transcriptional regulator